LIVDTTIHGHKVECRVWVHVRAVDPQESLGTRKIFSIKATLITTIMAHLEISFVNKFVEKTRHSESICGLFGCGRRNSIELLETRGSPAGLYPTIVADGRRRRGSSSTGRGRCLVNEGGLGGARGLRKTEEKSIAVEMEYGTF
jgi:hypothetical protein